MLREKLRTLQVIDEESWEEKNREDTEWGKFHCGSPYKGLQEKGKNKEKERDVEEEYDGEQEEEVE